MKKVLVLDDEKEILELWHWHFRLWGEKVELFTGVNGEEGVALLKDHKFDLIITDFKMPVMDGLDFIARVRETDKATPIFLFSGYIPELAFLGGQLDNVMFFEKPIIGGKIRIWIQMSLNKQALIPVEAI